MSKRLDIKEVIKRFRKKHGNKYDYSLVNYNGCDYKVSIICPIHGEFKQTPYKHFSQGCSACSGKRKITTDEFIKRSISVHGYVYDYSLSKIKNNIDEKVIIICPTHGKFKQTPNCHYNDKHGCPKCFGNKKLTTTEFINKSLKIHNNKYDYSFVKYKNILTKVKIICPCHGKFSQKPSDHLKGIGCSKCGFIETSRKRIETSSKEFISKALKVHGTKYNYSKVKYAHNKKQIIIICKKHGEFKQVANSHLNGRGCPVCKSSCGERVIENFLAGKSVKYFRQHKFKNCINPKTKEKLIYDFYIPSMNILIEYDGHQHYNLRFWVGKFKKLKKAKEQFKYQKYKDNLKTKYANKNKIKLIRISYLKFDKINEILDGIVKKTWT